MTLQTIRAIIQDIMDRKDMHAVIQDMKDVRDISQGHHRNQRKCGQHRLKDHQSHYHGQHRDTQITLTGTSRTSLSSKISQTSMSKLASRPSRLSRHHRQHERYKRHGYQNTHELPMVPKIFSNTKWSYPEFYPVRGSWTNRSPRMDPPKLLQCAVFVAYD
jgi:hypothetical protein